MEPSALDELLAKHLPLIRAFFLRKAPEDADDLVQETCCAIIDGSERFRGGSSITTWVYAICRNTFFHYLRTKNGRKRLHDTLAAAQSMHKPYEAPTEIDEMPDLVKKLTPGYRELYVLFYRRGHSIREIARLQQRPEGSIKFMLYDLRRMLREIIGAMDGR